MERIEIELGQGWSKGLKVAFENQKESESFNLEKYFHVEQVHGCVLYEVTAQDLKKTGPLAKADALMARGEWYKKSEKKMLVKTADCCPLMMVDRVQETAIAMHAGWKGLAKGFHRLPFEKGYLDPKTTWIWLGPSLNGSSFQVRSDLWEQFPKYKNNPQVFVENKLDAESKFFEVWKFLELEFESLGVDLFYNLEIDTFTDTDFASHRRQIKEGASPRRNYNTLGF